MATLVTGGTGFVGSNIVRELASRGHEVISLDVSPADNLNRRYLEDLESRVTFVTGSILNPSDLESLRQSYEIEKIVHAAVFTVNRVDLETARSRDIVDINITGTANLLELARLIGPQRFIYISSGSMYGMTRGPDQYFQRRRPVPRRHPLRHNQGRQRGHHPAVRRTPRLSHRQPASQHPLRPHGAGYRPPRQYVYPPPVDRPPGPGRAHCHRRHSDLGRDFTYVLDIASGIATVVDAPDLPHDRYNITNGVWVTGQQIQDTLKELYSETILLETGAEPVSNVSTSPARGPLFGYRLWRDFGWTPNYDLAAGLSHYVKWRREFGFVD